MSVMHWVAVLLVVVLVFGTKKLGNIGADLGKAVKGFKDGVSGAEEKSHVDSSALQGLESAVIDAKLKENAKGHV